MNGKIVELLFSTLNNAINFKLCFCLCVCVYLCVQYLYIHGCGSVDLCTCICGCTNLCVCMMEPDTNDSCLSQSVFTLLLRQNLSLKFQLTAHCSSQTEWMMNFRGMCVFVFQTGIVHLCCYSIRGAEDKLSQLSQFCILLTFFPHLPTSSTLNFINCT